MDSSNNNVASYLTDPRPPVAPTTTEVPSPINQPIQAVPEPVLTPPKPSSGIYTTPASATTLGNPPVNAITKNKVKKRVLPCCLAVLLALLLSIPIAFVVWKRLNQPTQTQGPVEASPIPTETPTITPSPTVTPSPTYTPSPTVTSEEKNTTPEATPSKTPKMRLPKTGMLGL